MSATTWKSGDTERAEAHWAKYVASHDVTALLGQTAGIDPDSGRVWFGESALDIVTQLDAANEFRPLYFVRVGKDYYLRKGSRL
jgi:hypothetical protein